MNSYYATTYLGSGEELEAGIAIIINNPVVRSLLHSISGLLAILDENRRVLALNDSFMEELGVEYPSEIIGLKLGEVMYCKHAHEEPGGCGTTKYCSTCGAAIAIVTTLVEDKAVDRICALSAYRNGAPVEISLLVRANPIRVDGKKFIMLFLQDITLEQQRASLERTFFHDINNMLTGLLGASQLLAMQNKESRLAEIVYESALHLTNEVAIQKCLFQSEHCDYQLTRKETTTESLLNDLRNVYLEHSATFNKNLSISGTFPSLTIRTDRSLALRVMCNMLTNALEATDDNGTVKAWLEENVDALVFCVWNNKSMPDGVRHRIFQRNFSTKNGDGRGIGTYSMKLLGEKLLGGKVSFTSSDEEGTVFRFALRR